MRQAKNVWWLYQARRVATQANVGGGAIIVDIAVPAGQVAKLISIAAINSGTNTLQVVTVDEDDADSVRLRYLGNAAGNSAYLPSNNFSGSSGSDAASIGAIIGPGTKLTARQTGAGLQNDTLTVAVTLLLSTNTEPTWSKARSANAADVALAASTISAPMQAVVM